MSHYLGHISALMEFYLFKGNQQRGPYSGDQIIDLFNQGWINHQDMIWTQGQVGWITFDDFLQRYAPQPSQGVPVPQNIPTSVKDNSDLGLPIAILIISLLISPIFPFALGGAGWILFYLIRRGLSK